MGRAGYTFFASVSPLSLLFKFTKVSDSPVCSLSMVFFPLFLVFFWGGVMKVEWL